MTMWEQDIPTAEGDPARNQTRAVLSPQFGRSRRSQRTLLSRLLLIALFLVPTGCDRRSASEASLYPDYQEGVRQFHDRSPQAVANLQDLHRKDSENGMSAYLLAAAYSQSSDWKQAATLLQTGNRAPTHRVPQQSSNSPHLFAPLGPLRTLTAKACTEAPRLGRERGGELLREVRVMGLRVAACKPHSTFSVLTGAVILERADKALVSLYGAAGQSVERDRAKKVLARDQQWTGTVRVTCRAAAAGLDPESAIRRSFTEAEWRAYGNGSNPEAPEALRARGARMWRDLNEKESRVAEMLIATMPD